MITKDKIKYLFSIRLEKKFKCHKFEKIAFKIGINKYYTINYLMTSDLFGIMQRYNPPRNSIIFNQNINN